MQKLTAPLLVLLCALPAGSCLSSPTALQPDQISLEKAITFSTPFINLYLANLKGTYADGRLTLTVAEKNASVQTIAADYRRPDGKTEKHTTTYMPGSREVNTRTLWSGPVAAADITYEIRDAVQTVKDSSGRILWTNAAFVPTPDVTMVKYPDGSLRVFDKSLKAVWVGRLPYYEGWVNDREDDHSFRLSIAGAQIERTDNDVTLTNSQGQLLWSAHFSQRPTMLIREGATFLFDSTDRHIGDSNQQVRLQFEAQPTHAEIQDEANHQSTTLPTELLLTKLTQEQNGRTSSGPNLYWAPLPTPPTHDRAITITFKDDFGKTVRTEKATQKVMRDDEDRVTGVRNDIKSFDVATKVRGGFSITQ